jgi:hypothetical protein
MEVAAEKEPEINHGIDKLPAGDSKCFTKSTDKRPANNQRLASEITKANRSLVS